METIIKDIKAVTDKQKPPCLTVTGTIMTYREVDKIKVVEGNTGINETILIFDVEVIEGSGPMKGTDKKFEYSTCKDISKYR